MNALFPPWSDTLLRLALAVLLILGVVATPALLMAFVRSPLSTDVGRPLHQPIQFDHRHHVRDDGIRCDYCHVDVGRSPTAGIPDTATCMGCHAQIWNDSPELDPVRVSWQRREPIVWQRVNDLPDFVYFDHRAHTQNGVGCETCHGRVDLMAVVYKAETLSMGFCVHCHQNPEPHLRPPELATVMGYVPSEPQQVLGPRLRRELGVDPPTNCSGCHR